MQELCLLLLSDQQFEADMNPLADSDEGLINALDWDEVWEVQSKFFAHMIVGIQKLQEMHAEIHVGKVNRNWKCNMWCSLLDQNVLLSWGQTVGVEMSA